MTHPAYSPPADYDQKPIKLRFGPSILDKAEQCPRAYALQYLCGYDTQEPAWSEIADHTYDKDRRVYVAPSGYVGAWETVPSRKRSTALGTECHARVEAHYEGRPEELGRPRWLDFPGQIAQAWLDVMPKPHECDQVFTELPVSLGDRSFDIAFDPTDELVGYLRDAMFLEGTSDLLLKVAPTRLQKRSSTETFWADSDGWLVGDWKTTRDWKYQKKPRDLYTNRQGVIYPLAAMRKLDLDAIPGRWAYSITDPNKRREARATDFVQTREHAEARVAEYFAEARALRAKGERFLALTDGGGAGPIAEQRLAFVQSEYPANTSACDDYGGCPHSWERGGACTARRTIGSRIMACATAPNKVDVPLESLLRNSLSTAERPEKGKNQMTSPWAAKAAQFRARAIAPEAPPPVDPATGLFATGAGPVRQMTAHEAQMAAAAVADPLRFQADMLREEARASVALDGETRSVEAGDSTGLDPQPEVPSPVVPETAPKARRGRPPGSKNRRIGMTPELAAPYPGTDPAEDTQARAMRFIDLAADEGEDDTAERTAEEYVTGTPAESTAGEKDEADFTLRDLAQAARSAGCEITIRFPGLSS